MLVEKMKRNNPKQPSSNYATPVIYDRARAGIGTRQRVKRPFGGYWKASNNIVYPVHISKG